MMKIENRRLRLAAILLAFAASMAAATLGVMGSLSAHAADSVVDAGDKEAHIVVQFDASDAVIRPISFTGDITGFRALELTGLEIEYTTDFGPPFVCSIEGIGCPADDCFCDPERSWGYWFWNGSDWESHVSGAGTTPITETGAIEGWQWGKWMEMSKPAPAPEAQAALRALDWLQERQSTGNGSYGGQVSPSLDVMLAIGANHQKAEEWRRSADAPSLMDFVSISGISYSYAGTSEAGKLATGVVAADGCMPPRALEPSDYYSDSIGSMSDHAGLLSWAILGEVSISNTIPTGSVDFLRGLALPAGGWEWSPGWTADTNTTAIAIQALVAGGVPASATEIVSGLAYLKSLQVDDGGFPYAPAPAPSPTLSDSNSTAWVVQALLAAGEDPRSDEWKEGGHTPIDYLLDVQLPNGSFEYVKGLGGDEFATRQVIPALLGSTLPMGVEEPEVCDVDSAWLPTVWSADAGPR